MPPSLTSRPATSVEAIAYFVVAEALTNVAKHARATRAAVMAARATAACCGWRSGTTASAAQTGTGSGLTGLADRVAGVDGGCRCRSPAGGPTVIEVELPCGS